MLLRETFRGPYDPEIRVNRQYRDRLFTMLFGAPDHKENALALYNALNGSNYKDPEAIQINTLRDVLYIHMKNDVSILLHDVMSLYEQQSTPNPNMPLRGLMYFASLYEKYIDHQTTSIYSSKLIRIPTPKYVVLYNGTEDQPARMKYRLSDAFAVTPDEQEAGEFEWTATVININRGRNDELLEKCLVLKDYMTLVNEIRDNLEAGMDLTEALDTAVVKCIEMNVLREFLTEHREEVLHVCMTEFDEDKFIATIMAEGEEKGEAKGIAIGMAKGREEGKEEGLNLLGSLMSRLLKAGRQEDAMAAAEDPAARSRLLKEFGLLKA